MIQMFPYVTEKQITLGNAKPELLMYWLYDPAESVYHHQGEELEAANSLDVEVLPVGQPTTLLPSQSTPTQSTISNEQTTFHILCDMGNVQTSPVFII